MLHVSPSVNVTKNKLRASLTAKSGSQTKINGVRFIRLGLLDMANAERKGEEKDDDDGYS